MKKDMMPKMLGLLAGRATSLLLCLLLPCLGVYAESWHGHTHYEYSGPWSWEESNCRTIQTATGFKEICDATITGYSGSSTDLSIPEKITLHTTVTVNGDTAVSWEYEATVTGIGPVAFYDRTDLISVTIPDTVVEICDGYYDERDYSGSSRYRGAFVGCRNLTSVTIGNNVTNIGVFAFYACESLQSVTFPSTLKRIGGGAFSYCSNLTDITIPDNVTSVETGRGFEGDVGAFEGCGCTNAIIGRGVRYIPARMFDDCSSLVSVTIPASVTSIERCAFYDCRSLTSITIPASVTNIGDYVFGDYGFYCRSAIKDVTVPQYVLDRSISGIFPSYWSITNIAYSGVITNISAGAFSGCNSLLRATVPNTTKSIGASAFSGCSGLTSVTIPDSVTSIGDSAFNGCSGLTSVTIPNSVTSIGNSAFSSCSNLKNVYLRDVANVKGIAVWCGIEFGNGDASPFYYAQNLYLNGELVTALEIPEGVTGIGNYAFCNCDCLQSVSIPYGVVSIGRYAFNDCDNIQQVSIHDSVANFGERAFYDCDNITIAAVPQSVMSQGLSTVFYRSYQNLQSLRLGANVSAIGVNEFANCRALTSVTVADGNTSYVVLADGCLYDMARNLILFCPRDKASVTIPNGVTTIGNYAFQYCTNLVSASMPETVQSIGSASFVGCAKLSGLTIPSSVQTLPTAAFNGCDVLWTEWYRALANLSVNGGGSSSGGNVEPVDPRYALAASPADRAIASVTVDRDCAIDQFVLTDGKVYDTVLRVVNTSASEVHLTLPAGYVYETFKGATPLTIPANSRNMLTITRTTGDTFLVTREELETVQ